MSLRERRPSRTPGVYIFASAPWRWPVRAEQAPLLHEFQRGLVATGALCQKIGGTLEAWSAGRGGAHFGSVDAEAETREVRLAKGQAARVEIAPHEQQQEGPGSVVFVDDRVDDGQREVQAQKNFRVGHPASFVPVGFFREGALLPFNIEFWRARKLALLPEDRFQDGLRVAHGNSDARGHDERQIEKRALPGLGAKLSLCNEIEAGDGARRGEEEWQIDEQHLEPALLEAHDHDRKEHRGKQNHERVTDVGGEVEEGFGFDVPGRVGLENFGEDFFRRLHQALGPACLLRFEAVHFHGQLGSALDLREVEKFPAFELRAIGKIGVFGEGVVFPASGIINGFAAPDAGGAVEIEESAAAGARTVLAAERAVEQNSLDIGEQGVVTVEIGPARLHHADFVAALWIHEIRNRAAEKIGFGQEIGVEDGHEFALCGFQTVFQGAGFVALAVNAMDVDDGHTLRSVSLDAGASHLLGIVRRVVENLHFQEIGRVVEVGGGFDETLDHVAFIEDRQLYCDAGPLGDRRRSRGNVFGEHEEVVTQQVAMQAENP